MKIKINHIKRLNAQYKKLKEDAAMFMMTGDVRNYLKTLIKAARVESAMFHA